MSDMQDDKYTISTDAILPVEVKKETDFQIKLELENESDSKPPDDYNPFKDIQLHVKKEISCDDEQKPMNTNLGHGDTVDDVYESGLIKEECIEENSLITYDYPNFDDSMDSSDATALGNVEACLQDEFKHENDSFEHGENGEISDVKQEADLTVTETHLIANEVMNPMSTNPPFTDIKSQQNIPVMEEIQPLYESDVGAMDKTGNPEEILPTNYENDDADYEDTFQLNSITGNILSLEQEAYGLLEAKNPKKVTSKNRTIYDCPKCIKKCTDIRSLNRHLKVHASIENYKMGIVKRVQKMKQNKLKKCEDSYHDEEIYNKTLKLSKLDHRNNDKNETDGYKCTCGQVFQRKSRMETCFRSHSLDSNSQSCYSCISCTKQFKYKHELQSHRRRIHRKRFPCKFCPTDYNTRKELFKHLQIHQKVQLMEYKVISEVMEGKQKLRCFMCEKTCAELSELKSHVMDDHKEPYVCPKCNETFSKIIDFGDHTKTEHPEVEGQSVLDVLEAFSKLVKAWKCEECGLQFHEADKLAKHQIDKHSPDLIAQPQFQCDDCRRVFISQKGLTSHRRIHHSTGSVDEVETVEGVMCIECRKICKDETALTSHMRLHSPERKYPCKFCDFRFATPEKRKVHMELHTGDMKYVCFICEYQCTSENRLKRHKLSEKHLKMKEYLIAGPAQEQAKDSLEEYNINNDPSSMDGGVVCDICGEKFLSTELMLEHKETHPFIEFPNEDTPTRIFFK